MSCVNDGMCGTGRLDPNTPKPGDPDNQISISAAQVFSGVLVRWTYPTTNPFAVAYWILYRGLTNDFGLAVKLHEVSGSSYLDVRNDPEPVTYYYWVQMVTVNGTVAAQVGPASATTRTLGAQTLESLTNLIDNGVLSQALKAQIARIQTNDDNIALEINARLAANTVLTDALAAVHSDVGNAMTYIQNEITQRTEGDTALVHQIDVIAAGSGDNAATITAERLVRANADSALASDINTLYVRTGDNSAAISAEQTARSNADSSMASQITSLISTAAGNTAAIQNESTTRANVDSAMASDIQTLYARNYNGDIAAAVQVETNARVAADSALSNQITTVESTAGTNLSQVRVSLSTDINTVDGKVMSMYTAQLSVNGLIGGFGIYNNGAYVEAGFDVDLFWVGRSSADKIKPFVIANGVVYIDKARIREADIDTLKIAGNSVTICLSEARYDTISGIDNWVNVLSKDITIPVTAAINVVCTCAQSSGSGGTAWQLELRINGTSVAHAGGQTPSDSVALSGSMQLSAGTYTVGLFQCSNGNSRVVNRNLTIMGALR